MVRWLGGGMCRKWKISFVCGAGDGAGRTGWSAVAMRLLNLSILSVPASFLAM